MTMIMALTLRLSLKPKVAKCLNALNNGVLFYVEFLVMLSNIHKMDKVLFSALINSGLILFSNPGTL